MSREHFKAALAQQRRARTFAYPPGQKVAVTIDGRRLTGHLPYGERDKVNGKYYYKDDYYGWAWVKASQIEVLARDMDGRANVATMEIQTRGVLAGSYKGGRATLSATQTHSVDSNTDVPLCGRVSPDNIADEYADDTRARPTCPYCLAKDPRFK